MFRRIPLRAVRPHRRLTRRSFVEIIHTCGTAKALDKKILEIAEANVIAINNLSQRIETLERAHGGINEDLWRLRSNYVRDLSRQAEMARQESVYMDNMRKLLEDQRKLFLDSPKN